MKTLLIAMMLLALSHAAVGDDHASKLTLEKRQADSVMTVTNVDLGDEVTTISAKGKMGVYGTVYVTYNLTYNADRASGFVTGQGRGAVDKDTVAAGAFRGIWTREGSIVKIRQMVQISDGSQNMDIIDIDMLKDTFVIKAYKVR
jgi:hypothetical protein